MSEYPRVDYPTILRGIIAGDKIRLESLDGSELVFGIGDALQFVPGLVYGADQQAFLLTNIAPFEHLGKTWGVAHQQKFSTWGWLKVSPDCYHRWWFWKLQQKDDQGNWLPGTERGLYFRKPFSWRWDVAGTMIDEILRHWIWTKGYLGGHWD